MKADKSKMFSVALASLKPESPAPFPLYIFLHLNNRMVPVRLEGDSIGQQKYEELLREHHAELWVPKSHEKEFKTYVEYLEKIACLPSKEQQSPPDLANEQTIIQNFQANAKGQDISVLARTLLKELAAIDSTGLAARVNIAIKCKVFSDDFLSEAAKSNDLFEGILALRSIQEPTEHSVFVGSTATVMAAATGKVDIMWLANLLAASTFHDIGLTYVSADVIRKPAQERSPSERKEFEAHVSKGVILLRDSEDKFPEDVIRMVGEHHEQSDGKGFPGNRVEQKLFLGSKFLILANQFDQLLEGKLTEIEFSPHEAMLSLIKERPSGEKISSELQAALETAS